MRSPGRARVQIGETAATVPRKDRDLAAWRCPGRDGNFEPTIARGLEPGLKGNKSDSSRYLYLCPDSAVLYGPLTITLNGIAGRRTGC